MRSLTSEKTHFDSLHHSVDDDGSKQIFLQRMSELKKQGHRIFTLNKLDHTFSSQITVQYFIEIESKLCP